MNAEQIRFRGTVQGVGFRPTVARIARAHGLPGHVRNDGEGVTVVIGGEAAAREDFLRALLRELPPLAKIDAIERSPCDGVEGAEFIIERSQQGSARTAVAPDAALCPDCSAEIRDPFARRYRYPFATCTRCGPRFTIITAVPYDRASTTMRGFVMCEDCRREFEDEADRRYHAQPIACGRCGPAARLVRTDGAPVVSASLSMLDDVDAVKALLQRGEIVAIKGLGGYQLCCDAASEAAVAELRARKRRPHKPFALLAWDVDQVRRYCAVSESEARALSSPAGPIVLLRASGERLAPSVAPGQRTLGFMLPSTPIHALILRQLGRPIVCTSGNLTEEPQCVDDDDAVERLSGIADWALVHDRPIAHGIDDSVVREMDGEIRVLRRARGYAPAPIRLHPSFAEAPPLLALGGHLKATFCLLRGSSAVLSPHVGDLDEPRTVCAYERSLRTLMALLDHSPARLALDAHPGYRTREIARSLGELPTERIWHHHAHAAAVLAEHGLPADAPPVLALVLDGLGMGEDGALWGCEVLVCDFLRAQRLASLPSVEMPGGDRCAREPWRSAVAHLVRALGWEAVESVPALSGRHTPALDLALRTAPRASSAGRLFDAVAAVLGLHTSGVSYEAQAALALEAAVDEGSAEPGYPVSLAFGASLSPLWSAVLTDLAAGLPASVIAARLHEGLALALADAARAARERRPEITTVVLSGGVWQNDVLLRRTLRHLRADGWSVLLPREVPPNDGGLSLGQAAIAAARALSQDVRLG